MASHHVVVVGASAGGVQALATLVAGLPADFPACVLVVLHIPPHTPTQLHTILARVGQLPVKQAEDGDVLTPGQVYVAPSDRHLLVQSDRLRVTRGPRENRARPAVDALFRSAAHALGSRVIGIVLSGTLDDGTAGLWAVKDRGGVALVQSPEDAQHPSMPESALRHVAVDHQLRVADMPALLVRLVARTIATEAAAAAAADGMLTEARIALEGTALQGGVMQLGAVSPNTCPECHGVLVRIREGSIARYRCHTGHAYSLETLLADVDEEIDERLWGALRAIEERVLLLQELGAVALEQGDSIGEGRYSEQARVTGVRVQRIRELVLEHTPFDRSE